MARGAEMAKEVGMVTEVERATAAMAAEAMVTAEEVTGEVGEVAEATAWGDEEGRGCWVGTGEERAEGRGEGRAEGTRSGRAEGRYPVEKEWPARDLMGVQAAYCKRWDMHGGQVWGEGAHGAEVKQGQQVGTPVTSGYKRFMAIRVGTPNGGGVLPVDRRSTQTCATKAEQVRRDVMSGRDAAFQKL